ncbi:hypothetical protein PIB30_077177 [Stylosanthes scabra]|uniref:Uncharacterized protein n=1 Tax=Stylosanthes scabra TaxID=79078 RepID=A0ABU6QRR0_9FABA|nr:hypothetical protein [Stylosanthes scabra]
MVVASNGDGSRPRIRHRIGDEAEAETVDRRRHNKQDDRSPSSVGVRIGEGSRGNGRRRRKNKEIDCNSAVTGGATDEADKLTSYGRQVANFETGEEDVGGSGAATLKNSVGSGGGATSTVILWVRNRGTSKGRFRAVLCLPAG